MHVQTWTIFLANDQLIINKKNQFPLPSYTGMIDWLIHENDILSISIINLYVKETDISRLINNLIPKNKKTLKNRIDSKRAPIFIRESAKNLCQTNL